MYNIIQPIVISCLTPTHVGSGSDLGHVDLPIQRESHTGFPKIEASSLKGALRERFEKVLSEHTDKVNIHLAFGYDADGIDAEIKKKFEGEGSYKTEFMGALGFSDARLLFFPVKSAKGVFALVTCPYILERFAEELSWGNNKCLKDKVEEIANVELHNGKCCVYSNSKNAMKFKADARDEKVLLEEFVFDVLDKSEAKDIIDQLHDLTGVDKTRVVIISDNEFKDFVELFTEKITRIKINNETGVVENGQLFSEEYLPAESILYSLVMASKIFQPTPANSNDTLSDPATEPVNTPVRTASNVIHFFKKGVKYAKRMVQLGGNATLGKGLAKISCVPVNQNGTENGTK